jgi:hypothetical protein
MAVVQIVPQERRGPYCCMRAQVPWVRLKIALNKRINDALSRFGAATAWSVSEPCGQYKCLTLRKTSTPAEDRARRDEQARGSFFYRLTVMQP